MSTHNIPPRGRLDNSSVLYPKVSWIRLGILSNEVRGGSGLRQLENCYYSVI